MSELVILDSSVWIEFFKGNPEYEFVDNILSTNTICTNEIILTELLPSIRKRREVKLERLILSIEQTIMNIDWEEIRHFQLLALKNGFNNINIPDLIIAQNCIQNDILLISCDKHFDTITGFSSLRLQRVI